MIRAELSHLHGIILLIIFANSLDLTPKHRCEPLQVSIHPHFELLPEHRAWTFQNVLATALFTSWTFVIAPGENPQIETGFRQGQSPHTSFSLFYQPQTPQKPGQRVQPSHTWADPCGLIPSRGMSWCSMSFVLRRFSVLHVFQIFRAFLEHFWSTLGPVLTQHPDYSPDSTY